MQITSFLSTVLVFRTLILKSAGLCLSTYRNRTLKRIVKTNSNMDTITVVNNGLRRKPFTVLVEGNIGSGKTSFLSHFSKYDALILSEPVNLWRNVNGHNMLELMYENQSKWSLAFQSIVQKTMLDIHLRQTTKPVKMMERSIFSARYCFVENLHCNNVMASPDYAVLDEWFKWILKNLDIKVDLIVYLRTDPDIVYRRMLGRGRKEEAHVPLTYLQQLHQMHEDWLFNKTAFSCPAPVVVLDANKDLVHMEEEYKKCEAAMTNGTSEFAEINNFSSVTVSHSPSKMVL